MSERSKVDIELRKLGFGGLDDKNLNQQIAFCIRDHEQFRNQLFSVEPRKRQLAYEQLRPHLRFTAKPLDVYESEMKQQAERQQLPTLREGEIYPTAHQVPEIKLKDRAEQVLAAQFHEGKRGLTLTCAHCTKVETFYAKTRFSADIEATMAGWTAKNDKSYCPEHSAKPAIQ